MAPPISVSPPTSSVAPHSVPSPSLNDPSPSVNVPSPSVNGPSPSDTVPSQTCQYHAPFVSVSSPFNDVPSPLALSPPLCQMDRGGLSEQTVPRDRALFLGVSRAPTLSIWRFSCWNILFFSLWWSKLSYFRGSPGDKTMKRKPCVCARVFMTQQAQTGEGKLYPRYFT